MLFLHLKPIWNITKFKLQITNENVHQSGSYDYDFKQIVGQDVSSFGASKLREAFQTEHKKVQTGHKKVQSFCWEKFKVRSGGLRKSKSPKFQRVPKTEK